MGVLVPMKLIRFYVKSTFHSRLKMFFPTAFKILFLIHLIELNTRYDKRISYIQFFLLSAKLRFLIVPLISNQFSVIIIRNRLTIAIRR